jgi:hypothetical protein
MSTTTAPTPEAIASVMYSPLRRRAGQSQTFLVDRCEARYNYCVEAELGEVSCLSFFIYTRYGFFDGGQS